jgi:hypothetical protein
MIVKLHNSDEYVNIKKSDYVSLQHYYEELMRIKFNKKLNSVNFIDELKSKIKNKNITK